MTTHTKRYKGRRERGGEEGGRERGRDGKRMKYIYYKYMVCVKLLVNTVHALTTCSVQREASGHDAYLDNEH